MVWLGNQAIQVFSLEKLVKACWASIFNYRADHSRIGMVRLGLARLSQAKLIKNMLDIARLRHRSIS